MQQSIEIDGMKVAYDVSGQGRPLILMHGWGCNHQTIASVAAVASATNMVFSLDLPGFGASDEPREPWTPERYAMMLRKFVEALGLERPILAGHSYGGRVATVYASRWADDVDSLILIDAAGVPPHHSLRWYWRVYTFKTGKWLLNIFLGKRRAAPIIERWRSRRGSADYRAASPMMRATLSASVSVDLRPLMPSIKAPTLLMWGEKDTATPLSDARQMEKLIPDAGLVVFPGAGHYSFLDAPAHFAAVISSFLSSRKS